MRRGRVFIYLALIIILGLAAFVLVWQRFLAPTMTGETTVEAAPTPVVRTVDVVVVAQRIPRGATLDSTVLSVIPIQEELFFGEMVTDIMDAEGKLAKFDLEAGIPLTNGMLVESGQQLSATGSIAALSIPRGMVAVSIPISRLSSVSYAPRAGDHVNVMAAMLFVDLDSDYQSVLPNRNIGVIAPGTGTATLTGSAAQSGEEGGGESGGTGAEFQTSSIVAVSGGGGGQIGRPEVDPILAQTFYVVPSEEQRPRMVSQNLLQDAVVLQVGDFPYGDQEEKPEPEATPAPEATTVEEEGQAPEPPKPPDLITLIVSPQDAITLNYLVHSGAQLTLALRPADDDTRIQTESVTLQFLLEQYNISVPARLPTGMEPPARELVQPELKNDIEPTPVP